MKRRKLLVVLEGAPGGGKTTLMEHFRNSSQFEGINQILPDNDPTDETITLAKILHSDHLKTEAYLKSRKDIVILDRYYQSTLSYHWAADKTFNEDRFQDVKTWVDDSLKNSTLIVPDYTFYVDVPFDLSLKRKERTATTDFSDPWTNREFLHSMRDYYLNLFQSATENVIFIDGQKNLDDIEAEIINIILQDKE